MELEIKLNSAVKQEEVKVLIVDDIPLNVLLVQKMLGQFKFQIITANDGASALQSVKEQQPDILLLDLMMPGIDGYEVIKSLRADEAYNDMPIVVLSALNSSDDVQKATNLGANDYITKPIIMQKLLSCVADHINKIWEKRQG